MPLLVDRRQYDLTGREAHRFELCIGAIYPVYELPRWREP